MATQTGKVKFFNTEKGFGFIKGNDGNEVFVHSSGLKDPIRQDDEVSYDTTQGKKGINAINVRVTKQS